MISDAAAWKDDRSSMRATAPTLLCDRATVWTLSMDSLAAADVTTRVRGAASYNDNHRESGALVFVESKALVKNWGVPWSKRWC